MSNSNYQKYLKYKLKYLELKNEFEGGNNQLEGGNYEYEEDNELEGGGPIQIEIQDAASLKNLEAEILTLVRLVNESFEKLSKENKDCEDEKKKLQSKYNSLEINYLILDNKFNEIQEQQGIGQQQQEALRRQQEEKDLNYAIQLQEREQRLKREKEAQQQPQGNQQLQGFKSPPSTKDYDRYNELLQIMDQRELHSQEQQELDKLVFKM